MDSNQPTAANCTAPWSYYDNGTCKCGHISEDILQCHIEKDSTASNCYCVTFDPNTGLTSAGNCVYACGIGTRKGFNHIHHTIPNNVADLDESGCGPFNRTGTLCGRCVEELYPLAHTLDMNCVECRDLARNWWKFLGVAFLPLTLFFFIVLFFNINVTSSHFHGFIWYSQGTIPPFSRVMLIALRNNPSVQLAARWVLAMYGIWTLDFFRSLELGICLGTDTLQTLALDLAIGVYPLFLMLVTYFLIHLYDRNFKPLVIIWKPFRVIFGLFRRNWEVRTSLIDAFGTFFLLSNIKFLSVSFDLLAPVKVYQFNSSAQDPEPNHTWRLFYDANVEYFGNEHLPYAIPAIMVLVFYMVLPGLLLMLYPFRWFQNMLNIFPFRWYVLHTFMDNALGCYKDGTEPGTRDCRWFASAFFILRFIIMLLGGYTLNASYFSMTSIVSTIFIILMVNIQPFRDNSSNNGVIIPIFQCLSALWNIGIVSLTQQDDYHPTILHTGIELILLTIALLPLLYASAIVVHWMYKHKNFGSDMVRRLRAWKQGYQLLN